MHSKYDHHYIKVNKLSFPSHQILHRLMPIDPRRMLNHVYSLRTDKQRKHRIHSSCPLTDSSHLFGI